MKEQVSNIMLCVVTAKQVICFCFFSLGQPFIVLFQSNIHLYFAQNRLEQICLNLWAFQYVCNVGHNHMFHSDHDQTLLPKQKSHMKRHLLFKNHYSHSTLYQDSLYLNWNIYIYIFTCFAVGPVVIPQLIK